METDRYGKKWWKGNLHTHSTVSDGHRTPEEVMALYQEKGYDFLALTDHWKLSEKGQYQNMLLFPGIELDTTTDGIWHIVGIDLKEYPQQAGKKDTAQELIDHIRQAGGLAILAHPAWSLDQPEDMAKLEGLIGTEIYNSVSGAPHSARPDSSCVLDLACEKGFLVPYMAADDTHFYDYEYCMSYIMVEAEELTYECIRQSLEAGRFYATQGPRIEASIENGEFVIRMDDASQVLFYSSSKYNRDTCTWGSHLTEARFTLKPSDHWVRAEITNEKGQKAWTSVFLTDHLF